MSRAVPSSYSEYLYTNSTNMICDGGIMPLRNGSASSTWYRKCLRGEDKIFLREAQHIRQCAFGQVGMNQPDNIIRASDMNAVKTQIGYWWNQTSYLFSATDPQVPAFVSQGLGNIQQEMAQYFTLPTRQSASDTYTVLSESAVMNLFRDMKQLNYAYATSSGRGTTCPYSWAQEAVYTHHEEENRSGYPAPPADTDITNTGYVWYENENLDWQKNEGYPSDLAWSKTDTMKSSSITFTERTSSPANVAKTCVELMPYANMYVYNSGYNTNYSGDSHSVTDGKYVVVPLKSNYTDMLNQTTPSVSSSEMDSAIAQAYSTAGLSQHAHDISLQPVTGTHTHRDAFSSCYIVSVFYIVHFMYCSLENVNIPSN